MKIISAIMQSASSAAEIIAITLAVSLDAPRSLAIILLSEEGTEDVIVISSVVLFKGMFSIITYSFELSLSNSSHELSTLTRIARISFEVALVSL